MIHLFRACAVLAAAPALLAQAGFPARLAGVEALLARHFRGEPLETAQTRVNALVDAYNALLDAYNFEVQVQNQAVAAGQVLAPRDLAFFREVNGLLADIRGACRLRPVPENRAALDRIRAIRLELARWAAEAQAAQPNGLVLVAALVGDEPCCFIVDTGAQVVSVPQELGGSLGEEVSHILAGGLKTRGRSLTLPRVATAGMAATDVAGSVLPASEVGIDGLLGQSFLKRFVYTIDEGRPGKLILAGR